MQKKSVILYSEKVERICELSNITGDQELQNNGMLYLLKIWFLN